MNAANHPLTPFRIGCAFAVAVVADLVQLPLNAAFASGLLSIPAEIGIIIVDFIALFLTSSLLGFHWLLLPSVVVEAIPGVDILPTWTGCVALLVRARKQQQRQIDES